MIELLELFNRIRKRELPTDRWRQRSIPGADPRTKRALTQRGAERRYRTIVLTHIEAESTWSARKNASSRGLFRDSDRGTRGPSDPDRGSVRSLDDLASRGDVVALFLIVADGLGDHAPCSVASLSSSSTLLPVSPCRITKSRRSLYSSARFRTSSPASRSMSSHSVIVQYL